MRRFALTIFVLRLTLGPAIAAPPAIGTVTANGAFHLNGDTVLANGTLTEGAMVETTSGASSVRLTGGARLSLSSDSRGKLFSDHIVLEKGETSLENGTGFYLEALGLVIRPDRGISTGQVGVLNSNRVRVAPLTGSFRVLNAGGALVANVSAGSALAFEPVAPVSAGAASVTGVLTQRNGHFLLTDQVTRVAVEITGPGLMPQVGRVVQVTGALNAGATPVAGASEVIAAAAIHPMSVPSTVGVAGGVVSGPSGGAPARLGIGVVPTTVLGGVAASATSLSRPAGVPAGPPPSPPGQPPGRPPVTPPGQPPGQPPGRPPISR